MPNPGYTVVFEHTDSGYVAWIPDVPGCVAGALTLERTEELVHEALYLHRHTLKAEGIEISPPSSFSKTIYLAEDPSVSS